MKMIPNPNQSRQRLWKEPPIELHLMVSESQSRAGSHAPVSTGPAGRARGPGLLCFWNFPLGQEPGYGYPRNSAERVPVPSLVDIILPIAPSTGTGGCYYRRTKPSKGSPRAPVSTGQKDE